ncbi:MAG: hypothetical protein JNM58_01075 [Xanthomonadaceae bacterium]|nr:hypothetical protein [Xanthomonadaceae bacterium]
MLTPGTMLRLATVSVSGSLADKRSELRKTSIGKWGLTVSNVIQFLEAMGSNSMLARMSSEDFSAMLTKIDAGNATKQSLLNRDAAALASSMDTRPIMFCWVAAPDQESPAEQEGPMEEDDGDKQQDE